MDSFGLKIFDAKKEVTYGDTRLARFVKIINIDKNASSSSSPPSPYTVDLSNYEYDKVFLYFDFASNETVQGIFGGDRGAPRFTVTGTTMTITPFGVSGRAFIGVI